MDKPAASALVAQSPETVNALRATYFWEDRVASNTVVQAVDVPALDEAAVSAMRHRLDTEFRKMTGAD